MRTAYFDLIGGAAGDMLLAALVDAGASLEGLRAQVEGLGLGATLEVRREVRGFLSVRRVEVRAPASPVVERHLADILRLIEESKLTPRGRDRASRVFRALARAEGRVHGVEPEAVHFHEVGAVDAIVDVVGVLAALDLLGVDRVESSPLPLARGTTRTAHGEIPLPAPAVLALAEAVGAPIEGREAEAELVTPTAAALLTTLAERFGPYPGLRVERVGYGAGSRESLPGRLPNVTRVVLGQAEATGEGPASRVVVIETSVDDQSGELTAYVAEALRAAGALEVFLTPVQMKKGRPGVLITVLAEPARAGLLEDLLLGESSTLGVRRREEMRSVLPRVVVRVATPYGEVRVKQASRPDGRRSAAPEYEDCARLASERGVPWREVYRAALRASEPGGNEEQETEDTG